ncbi:MAG: BON domain-containing protein [Anaerolineae bacterium]|nr:BON domain-containing protein [Anaerolineae bacterium]
MIHIDGLIKTDIVEEINRDRRIDASNIKVVVDNGVATLSGVVPSYSAKLAAAENAWVVNGVTSVRNMLKVRYKDSLKTPSDSEMQSAIIDRLAWNPYLLAHKFDVGVHKGWVTLAGTVDAFWKQLEAEREALSIRGVTGMTNKIAVVTTEDKDEKPVDEAIAKDIMNAIHRNRKVDVNDVNVKVEDGKVILTGKTSDQAARLAAYRSVLYTFGVTYVDNKILVG